MCLFWLWFPQAFGMNTVALPGVTGDREAERTAAVSAGHSLKRVGHAPVGGVSGPNTTQHPLILSCISLYLDIATDTTLAFISRQLYFIRPAHLFNCEICHFNTLRREGMQMRHHWNSVSAANVFPPHRIVSLRTGNRWDWPYLLTHRVMMDG